MRLLALVALALVLFTAYPAQQRSAEAAVLVVDDDGAAVAGDCDDATAAFSTISAAVAAAAAGDVINVCPGLYAEQVDVDKTLTLLGAQAGIDARTRPFVAANESIIDWPDGPVQVLADNVVIDGFTIQGADSSPILAPAALGAGIWTNPGFSGTSGGHQIVNNVIQDNIVGIYLNHDGGVAGIDVALVEHNLIRNNNLPGPSGGTGIYSDNGLHHLNILSNTFTGQSNAAILFAGIQSNVSINLNFFDAGAETMLLINTTDSNIEENVSIGVMSDAALHLAGGNDTTQVRENVFRNGERGILLTDSFGPANQGITVASNCIQDNSDAGLEAPSGAYAGFLNAEDNWWGSASGPVHPANPGGAGDLVIDPDGVVDVLPFSNAPLGFLDCPIALPTPTSKDDCKNGGWKGLFDDEGNAFKNQGQCIKYVTHP